MRGWHDIGSDVNWEDYGGAWAKRDPSEYGVWWVIVFTNLHDAMGERDALCKYEANVRRIALLEVPKSEIEAAYKCCGLSLDDPDYQSELVQVEALNSYGVYAPMKSFSGDTYASRIRANARRFVEQCTKDSDKTCDLLDRPVNKIGSTARDFQRGNVLAGLERYAVDSSPPDKTKDLMLKLHGVSEYMKGEN